MKACLHSVFTRRAVFAVRGAWLHFTVFMGCVALVGCAQGTTILGTGGSGGAGQSGPSGTGQTSTGSKSAATSTSQTTGPGMQTVASSSSTGTACTETPCKLTSPQCGCSGTDGCTVDATGTHICSPSGTAVIGGACSAANNCAPGGICLGATIGTCFKFCATDNECTLPGGHCLLQLNDGMGGTLPNITMCSQNCDPAVATSCNVSGVSCQVATDTVTMKTFTSCIDAGAAGLGAACPNGSGDCQAGLGCFNVGAATECLPWCRVGVTICGGGKSCLSLNPQLLLTPAIEYGVCN